MLGPLAAGALLTQLALEIIRGRLPLAAMAPTGNRQLDRRCWKAPCAGS